VAFVGSSGSAIFTTCTLAKNSAAGANPSDIHTNEGGVAYVVTSGSLTLRGSTTTNNTLNGELYAFYIDSSASLNIINPHPSSQADTIRSDPSKLATCTNTPCELSETCASAAPSLGVICTDIPYVNRVSCGDPSTADRQVLGCSTTGILTITLVGANLDDPTSVAVGAGACSVTSSSATSLICTVATALVWGSAEVNFPRYEQFNYYILPS